MSDIENIKYYKHLLLREGLKLLQDKEAFKNIASLRDVIKNPTQIFKYLKMRKSIRESAAAILGKSRWEIFKMSITKRGWDDMIEALERNISSTP